MITQTVRHFIEKQQLLSPADRVLVALSGGSDSVALLLILCELGYECVAAHCNFHLRDEESDRDERFVRQLCSSLKIPLNVIDFDTKYYATEHHLSIEMAARELRYDWFSRLTSESNTKAIAVAHHRNDSVETVLLNLIRGTGIHGLCGIQPRNGNIIRPLLCVSHNQIIDYLQSLGQAYVTDSTNLQDEFTRNKIRLKILPLMEEINPSVVDSIQKDASYMSQAARIYDSGITEGRKRVMHGNDISILALKSEPSAFALLFELLHPFGFNSAQIGEIFESIDGQSGKTFTAGNFRVVKDRDKLLIRCIEDVDNDSAPPFDLAYHEYVYTTDFVIPRERNIACFDRDKLGARFTLRKWQEGDRFEPFGMKGKKLVSDFLTDLKLSIIQKQQQWVLCSDSSIVWVVGFRPDNRFRIDVHTKHVVVVEMIEKNKK